MEQPGHIHPLDPRQLAIDDLTYALPEDRIAQHPLAERDGARLLVFRDGGIRDRLFKDLPQELPPDTLLVLNDTKVVHARIRFRRATGALIECMVLSPEKGHPMELALRDRESTRWWCMVGNAKRWKGEELLVEGEGQRLRMARLDQQDGEHLIEFRWEGGSTFLDELDRFGTVPLPPYMRRAAEAEDDRRYNTVFGEHPGSVAAPTASLHFTPGLLEAMAHRGLRSTRVTLHVGAGTFLPVKSPTMEGHHMHSEQVRIPRRAVEQLLGQAGRGPIVPVGTTAVRTIESLYWFGADRVLGFAAHQLAVEQWRPYAGGPEVPVVQALQAVLDLMDREAVDEVAGTTRLLIAPGYRFRLCSGLVTNFHQPRSTLLLLVAALIGPAWRDVYDHALQNGYRFLSYGDGSLLWGSHAPRHTA
ncbi:MAG: S-adenosylmethionine:tRNA ribosyltransferase-isomerase [Flavobacteriales bacterium]|nr:S-adenosylmethionine:tRNA ribosyltransferase-isomerase [Flavobacteriales bacterium]